MKIFIQRVLIVCVLTTSNTFSQEVYQKTLLYKNTLRFKKIKDSLNFIKRYKGVDNYVLKTTFYPSQYEKYLVKKDTVLIHEYGSNKLSEEIKIITTNQVSSLDLTSGVINNHWKDYTPLQYLDFKTYKAIPKENKIILNKQCQAYISKSKYGERKVWLASITENIPQLKNTRVFLDNRLILKESTYYKDNRRIIDKTIISVEPLEMTNFKSLINDNTEVDITLKYKPIKENERYKDTPIKIDEKIEDLYFRNVFNNKLRSIHKITNKSDYTIVELWGSWCAPCLIAVKKIVVLRDKYKKEKLNILSLNVADRKIEKVKSLIKNKNMEWEHGYATKKIISILNHKGVYPRIIVLNKQNKILFIGNPMIDIDKVERILNE